MTEATKPTALFRVEDDGGLVFDKELPSLDDAKRAAELGLVDAPDGDVA